MHVPGMFSPAGSRSPQLEVVGVNPGGELLAEGCHLLRVDCGREGSLAAAGIDQRAALEVDDGRVARIFGVGVATHAVDADDVTLVLDGPGPQQRAPYLVAVVGPRGAVDDGVVVTPVAAPDGEAQVVADQQQEADTDKNRERSRETNKDRGQSL